MYRRIVLLGFALAGALAAPVPARAQAFGDDPFARPAPERFERSDRFEPEFGREQFAQQDPFGGAQQNFNAQQARDAQQTGQVAISAVQARMLALTQVPGAEYLDLELSAGPMPIYTVHLRTSDGRRVDVMIDAQTGAILGRR